jgi:hypothetical protein
VTPSNTRPSRCARGIVVLSWQEHIGSTIVHVLDFAQDHTLTHVTPAKGALCSWPERYAPASPRIGTELAEIRTINRRVSCFRFCPCAFLAPVPVLASRVRECTRVPPSCRFYLALCASTFLAPSGASSPFMREP